MQLYKTTMTKIRQTLLLAFAFLATSYSGYGQTKKRNTVEIVQNFQTGKKYRYEVLRGNTDSRKPGNENIKSCTDVEFCIINKKKDIKECSWKYGQTKITGVNMDQLDEQARKQLNLYEGIEVKFLVDQNGTILEITNFEECKASVEKAFELLYSNTNRTPEQYEKIKGALKSTFKTPEILVSTYCPELSVYFNMFGKTISSDSVVISHSELANPFGGRGFPTDVSTKIDEIRDNVAIISTRQTIPQQELKSIMKETFTELNKLSERPVKEEEIPEINITIFSTSYFDIQKKELKEVSLEKFTDVDDVKQTQTLKIILKN